MSNALPESLMNYIASAGLWLAPIAIFSLLAASLLLLKTIQVWRLPRLYPKLNERLNSIAHCSYGKRRRQLSILESENLSEMQQSLFNISLATPLGKVRDDLILERLNENKKLLEEWLQAITVIAVIPPGLGLLAIFIEKTLLTLELGLIVAIPILVLNIFLSRTIKSYYDELGACASQFNQLPTGA